MRYFIAIWCMFIMSNLTSHGGTWRFSKTFSDCLCITLCTSIVMVTREFTFQLSFSNIWMRGSYLLDFFLVAVMGNLSWQ